MQAKPFSISFHVFTNGSAAILSFNGAHSWPMECDYAKWTGTAFDWLLKVSDKIPTEPGSYVVSGLYDEHETISTISEARSVAAI